MRSKSECDIYPQTSVRLRRIVLYAVQHLNHAAKIVKRIEIMVSQDEKVVSQLNFFLQWVRTPSVTPITESTTLQLTFPHGLLFSKVIG